ncbi:hypothetical protein [Nocardia sp. CA-120079]|uniref:hypothetical protein n=1 Tax=Nocardia sp. CA-120079 TaxID=3239974 RepID=UPI003D95B208
MHSCDRPAGGGDGDGRYRSARAPPAGPGRDSAEHVGGVEWVRGDIRTDDLAGWFHGADVVVHLAWVFQPARRPMATWHTNVDIVHAYMLAIASDAARQPRVRHTQAVPAR